MVGFPGWFEWPMDGRSYVMKMGGFVEITEAVVNVQEVTPLTGATIIVGDDTTHVLLNPATALAALTVQFPPDTVKNNKRVRIASTKIITILAITTPGASIVGGLGGLAVGAFGEWMYRSAAKVWHRIG